MVSAFFLYWPDTDWNIWAIYFWGYSSFLWSSKKSWENAGLVTILDFLSAKQTKKNLAEITSFYTHSGPKHDKPSKQEFLCCSERDCWICSTVSKQNDGLTLSFLQILFSIGEEAEEVNQT